MDEPRTHYQISLTGRQAVGLFVGLLCALALAFFFGLMAGLSGRGGAPVRIASAIPERETSAASEPLPAVETAVPTLAASGPSRTEIAGAGRTTPIAVEPTVPSTLQPFEDGTAEEAAPVSPGEAGPPAPSVGRAAPPGAGAAASESGKFWVQVVSLRSREEAGALALRLSRHGFRAQVLSAGGPRGRVFRVRVGPFRSEEEAGHAATKLTKQERIQGPWVVPDGK